MLESPVVGAQRILRGASASLKSFKFDESGEPANPGTTTVTVTRGDGTVIDTDAATTEDTDTHELVYALDAADNDRLDWLTAVWTDTIDATSWTTYHEVVGGFYFSVRAARLADPALADVAKWPDATIQQVRDEVEREFESEDACGRAFVPRYRRARVRGGGRCLVLPDVDIRTIRSVRSYTDATTYTAFTDAEIAAVGPSEAGVVYRSDRNVWSCGVDYVIEYEYGLDRPPSDLQRAAIQRLRSLLGKPSSGIPDKAVTFTPTNSATAVLASEGRNGWITAIPAIDAVLMRYRFEHIGVA